MGWPEQWGWWSGRKTPGLQSCVSLGLHRTCAWSQGGHVCWVPAGSEQRVELGPGTQWRCGSPFCRAEWRLHHLGEVTVPGKDWEWMDPEVITTNTAADASTKTQGWDWVDPHLSRHQSRKSRTNRRLEYPLLPLPIHRVMLALPPYLYCHPRKDQWEETRNRNYKLINRGWVKPKVIIQMNGRIRLNLNHWGLKFVNTFFFYPAGGKLVTRDSNSFGN